MPNFQIKIMGFSEIALWNTLLQFSWESSTPIVNTCAASYIRRHRGIPKQSDNPILYDSNENIYLNNTNGNYSQRDRHTSVPYASMVKIQTELRFINYL